MSPEPSYNHPLTILVVNKYATGIRTRPPPPQQNPADTSESRSSSRAHPHNTQPPTNPHPPHNGTDKQTPPPTTTLPPPPTTMTAKHQNPTYRKQARIIRTTAYLNPHTRCRRCGLTLNERRLTHPHATWDAGHHDQAPNDHNQLAAECSTCNRTAGAHQTNSTRTGPLPI